MNLRKEIKDVLWGVVNPTDAMWLNTTAIKRLQSKNLIPNPYNGKRTPDEVINFILSEVKGREKEVLNALPFKDKYSSIRRRDNDNFVEKYNIPRPRTFEEKRQLINDIHNIKN